MAKIIRWLLQAFSSEDKRNIIIPHILQTLKIYVKILFQDIRQLNKSYQLVVTDVDN